MQKAIKSANSPRKPRAAAGPRVPTQENYRVLAAFRHALLRFLAFSEAAANEAGLTPKQHQALLAIKGVEDNTLNVQQLADRLLIQHNSAVELANRLAASDLVTRGRDPDDGRRVQVGLTPKAERLLLALSTAHLNELKAIKPIFVTLLSQLD